MFIESYRSLPLLALLKHGDHVLMVDSVYGPVRTFCDGYLPRIGVEVTYYDPLLTIVPQIWKIHFLQID